MDKGVWRRKEERKEGGRRVEDGRLHVCKRGMEDDGTGTAKLDFGVRWGSRTSALEEASSCPYLDIITTSKMY